MAESFGIDIVKVRYLNFFIGSALAGIAGVMVSILNNLVEPTMGGVASYKALAIIVLGGLGNVRGTLAAALTLGVLEAYGTIRSEEHTSELQSLMRISYAVFCLKKKKTNHQIS